MALLLGVEVYEGVSFDGLLEPEKADDPDGRLDGWRARVTPADHPVAQFQFNALIGADGKRNTLQARIIKSIYLILLFSIIYVLFI